MLFGGDNARLAFKIDWIYVKWIVYSILRSIPIFLNTSLYIEWYSHEMRSNVRTRDSESVIFFTYICKSWAIVVPILLRWKKNYNFDVDILRVFFPSPSASTWNWMRFFIVIVFLYMYIEQQWLLTKLANIFADHILANNVFRRILPHKKNIDMQFHIFLFSIF